MNKTRIKIIGAVIGLMLIGFGLFTLLRHGDDINGNKAVALFSLLMGGRSNDSSNGSLLMQGSGGQENSVPDVPDGASFIAESSVLYTHPQKKFSVKYPPELNPVLNRVDENEALIFDLKDAGGKSGFQIVISSFDEEGALTEKRIKDDLPDLPMQNVRIASVAGVQSIAFRSHDDTLGNLFEIWFAHRGDLYQITTYEQYTQTMLKILETWRFNL